VLDLLRWAEKNGMATAPGAPTNYAELTIGGVISANGHGTGSNVTSSMVRLQQKAHNEGLQLLHQA
jgi:FAD/FMN-containing dehydrogenase